jgi:hypothetical protein
MSGSRPSVGIRVDAQGADQARRQLEAIGPAGEAAFKRVANASTAAGTPMKVLASASDGLARSLGSLPGPMAAIAQQSAGLASGMGGASTAMIAAAAAGTLLGAALGAGLAASIREAEQFERLGLRTEAVIRATGGAAGLSAQQIREMSQELARGTLASTEGVEAASQKLLTFRTVAGDTFGRTLRAAQDLAAVGFGTLDSAIVQLGKALENPIAGVSALAEVGVSFSAAQKGVIKSLVETGEAAEAQRIILAAVEQQVGGAGSAEAGGLAGAYDTLSQNAQEFLVRVGNTGPLKAAQFGIEQLANAVAGLNALYDGGARLLGGGSAMDGANAAVRAADERYQAAAANQDRRDPNAAAMVKEAHADLMAALMERQRIEDEALRKSEEQARKSADEQAKIAREGVAARLNIVRDGLRPEEALREKHKEKLATIAESEQRGLITAAEATRLRGLAEEALTKALEKTADAHKKVAKEAADADAHVKVYLKEQEKAAKAVAKAQEKAAREIERFHERSFDAVANIGERAMDRIGDAMVDAFLRGEGASVNFGNVLRGVIASALADLAKLAVVNPILNSLFTSSGGARPTLSGAFGGSSTSLGGIGDILGIGQMFGGESIGSMLGLTGAGGLMGATIINGIGPATGAALGGMGGALGPASLSQLNATGLMGFGGSGATLGSLLGGVGAGFGTGMMLNSLLGGNQTSGMIGSGGGAVAGAIIGSIVPGIGTLIGGLIGGALGGAGGGMIGPKDSVKAWGYWLEGQDGALKPIDRQWYNESGAQQFAYADQQVAATNAYLAERGLTVSGSRNVGGNKNGPDGTWGGAGSFEEAFADLRFAAAENATLSAALAERSFQGAQSLAEFVEQFTAADAAIKALSAETIPAYTASIQAVNDNFQAARQQAVALGVSIDGMAEAQARAIGELEAARTEQLRQSGVALSIRMMAARGQTLEADLARQAEAAAAEVKAFGAALDALAITAEDRAARLVNLEEVQAAERAAIIQRWGEQAAQALRQAGGTIRAYLDSLAAGTAAGASPEDRLAAAQAQFDRDRTLSMGGDRDALGRVTGSADALLSAGRDMFASAPEFQAILAAVRGGLEGLPVLQSYDAMQAASLTAIQAAIEAGTLNTAIVPGGNTVQIANLGELTGIASGLALLHATAADQLGTAVQQAAGIISLGVYLAAANAYAEAGNWRLHHLAQLGEAINGNATLANRIAAEASAASVAGFGALTRVTVDSNAAITTSLALANTLLAANDNRLRDLNTSLHTIDRSARDVNASLATVDARIAAVQAAQTAGNVIAFDAATAITGALAAQNMIGANQSATLVAALNAGNVIAADAAMATVSALNAANLITAGGADATVAALNAGNTIQATYFGQSMIQRQQLIGEVTQLRQQVAILIQAVQQAGILTANETRTGSLLVAAKVEQVDDTLRKQAA